MGTGIAGFSVHNHFSELADPLDSQEGVLSPLVRRQRSLVNLGVQIPVAAGGAARMTMPAVATATDTATLTTAQILNGVIHGTPTAAATYTTPTGTALDTALGASFVAGEAVEFSVANLAATATFDITMAGGTGVTTVGLTRVGAGSATPNIGDEWQAGIFRLRKTATATYQLIRVG